MADYSLKCGMVCRHHSGRVYTILMLANVGNPSPEFPVTVVYVGANGKPWTRPLSQFLEKFEVLFDGANIVEIKTTNILTVKTRDVLG